MCMDLEPCDVWRETSVKARKPHACIECGGNIPRGYQYVQISWVGDGRAGRMRMHRECRALWDLVAEICDEPQICTGGYLREQLREHEDYWRDQVGKADGIPFEHWRHNPEILGPGLEDILDCVAAGYEDAAPWPR